MDGWIDGCMDALKEGWWMDGWQCNKVKQEDKHEDAAATRCRIKSPGKQNLRFIPDNNLGSR